MTTKYVVVKNSSSTANKKSWTILSRELKTEQSAKDWLDFLSETKPHKRTKKRLEILTLQRP
jgi:hypothetical protein